MSKTQGPEVLDEYLKNAPDAARLDDLERRKARGEIGIIRQVRPGTYTYVESGKLVTTGKS